MITKDITRALQILRQDNLIAIPTETVYGLAANAFSERAVEKIFAMKKRPLFNPLIVHISSAGYLEKVAQHIPPAALTLAKTFWPGPLTLVLEKQSVIPDLVSAGKDTVALRVPDHPLTLELLSKLDFPLAAPSANPFGSISPTHPEHVQAYFGEKLEVILDGGPCKKGIESTIIGFENEQPIIYRMGSLSLESIEKKVGPIQMQTKSDDAPAAPGMLSRHYAPSTKTYLSDKVEQMITSFAGKRIGLLSFQEPIRNDSIVHQEVLSPSGDMEEAARNLYSAMHRLDQIGLDVILAERMPDEGLGRVINDKLERASEKAPD